MMPAAGDRADAGRGHWYLLIGTPAVVAAGPAVVTIIDVAGRRHRFGLPGLEPRRSPDIVVALPAPPSTLEVGVVDTLGAHRPVDGYSLQPLGRAEAFARMLQGPRGSWLRRAARIAAGAGMVLRHALGGRPREGLHALAARYQASLMATNGEAGIHCDVAIRRIGGTTAATWRPLHDLVQGPLAGQWEALGDDPQYRLDRDGAPLRLPAGWYRVEADVAVVTGRIVAPALYPDYGRGHHTGDMLRLPEPDARGRIRALVLLKAPAASLRFDPSVRQARFTIDSFVLRRVGRVGALWSMLDRCRRADGSRDWPAIAAATFAFARDVGSSGLSAAASRLYDDAEPGAGAPIGYGGWVRRYDTFDAADLALFAERAARVKDGPLVSILVPVYETPERWLRRCLDSVIAQAYPNWELCIVDDASLSPHVQRILADYACRDARIRVQRRAANGHISAASNDALAMARGAYVALLDHDDELRPHALLEMVEAIAREPAARLLYSDEDKIDECGRRFAPNFKPDWNPDLLRSQNYVCHFAVIATGLARGVGGFRTGYEGSQDHDLFLRCAETLDAAEVVHVPRVLYHWRAIAGSTALERGAKDYAAEAGARAVADHVDRIAPGARVDALPHGHYRVRWPLPAPPPRASIVIPTRDRVELLRACVDSILAHTAYPDYEILIVDNQSSDPATLAYLDAIATHGRIGVLRYDAPFNYSAINNWAVRQATGSVLCLLNNDIEVLVDDWLCELVSQAIRPGIGAVGAMLYYPDRTIQHAGVILGLGGVANHVYAGQPAGHPGHGARALVAQNLSAVTGACLAVMRERYLKVGGLDERLQVAFNDIDFCLRLAQAGYRNVWTPFAELVHHESASRGRDEAPEKRERFLREVALMESRWGELLQRDPAYNPNLSLDDLHAGLASPPRAA